MAKLSVLGRRGQVIYGQYALLSFKVNAVTRYINNIDGSYTVGENDSYFTPGSMTVLGTAITLTAADCISEASVAAKIASGITAAGAYYCYSDNNIIHAQYQTSVGVIAKPTIASYYSATRVCISDYIFTQGVPMPSTVGPQDDIVVGGGVPFSAYVAYTGGTQPTLFGAVGTDMDQALGNLNYISIPLTNGLAVVTTPYSFIRVTTMTGNTQAILSIIR